MRLLLTITFCFFTLILSVKAKAQIITTVVGNGTRGYAGDSGLAINAELNQPFDIAFDSADNMYIAEYSSYVIRKVNKSTNIITTIAGVGYASYNGDSILATKAEINHPNSIVLDKKGNIYFSDEFNNRIRKIDVATGIITTFAGNGSIDTTGDGGLATNASIAYPTALIFSKSYDELYFSCESTKSKIRKINMSTNIISTVANTTGYDVEGLAFDSSGILYAACDDNRIRKINVITGLITLIAGTGSEAFEGDGDSVYKAEFSYPSGVLFDSLNNYYIADFGNDRIRKVDNSTDIINTIAGSDDGRYNGENLPALESQITPYRTKTDTRGEIYIVDVSNNRIRKITNTILPVKILSFTAQKQNNTSLLQWQTTNEINNNYFDIERSPDSKLFYSIGTKQGLNNSGTNYYSFVDNTPIKSINYYRLKQVDKDGKFDYSQIASVDFINDKTVFAVSPNPADNIINVIIPQNNSVSEIFIYNVEGKKILHEAIAANISSKQINISTLTAGVYDVVLIQNGKREMMKLVKK